MVLTKRLLLMIFTVSIIRVMDQMKIQFTIDLEKKSPSMSMAATISIPCIRYSFGTVTVVVAPLATALMK
ncbi:hypothetical protein AN651_19845 [Xanthomonas arboricola]|nr:hypothetical protein AN651_19845 [Xanthomonas arboricola]